MKKAVERLGAFDEGKKCVNVIMETPKRSRVKYSFDPEPGSFQLKRAIPERMTFPFNFGFIPSTLGEEGDPLDIIVLNEEAVAVADSSYITGQVLHVNGGQGMFS